MFLPIKKIKLLKINNVYIKMFSTNMFLPTYQYNPSSILIYLNRNKATDRKMEKKLN